MFHPLETQRSRLAAVDVVGMMTEVLPEITPTTPVFYPQDFVYLRKPRFYIKKLISTSRTDYKYVCPVGGFSEAVDLIYVYVDYDGLIARKDSLEALGRERAYFLRLLGDWIACITPSESRETDCAA